MLFVDPDTLKNTGITSSSVCLTLPLSSLPHYQYSWQGCQNVHTTSTLWNPEVGISIIEALFSTLILLGVSAVFSFCSDWKLKFSEELWKHSGGYSLRSLYALGLIYLACTILTENNSDRVRKESGQKMLIYIFSFRTKHKCALPGKC